MRFRVWLWLVCLFAAILARTSLESARAHGERRSHETLRGTTEEMASQASKSHSARTKQVLLALSW
jgi:hypothetical protein